MEGFKSFSSEALPLQVGMWQWSQILKHELTKNHVRNFYFESVQLHKMPELKLTKKPEVYEEGGGPIFSIHRNKQDLPTFICLIAFGFLEVLRIFW